MFLILRFIYLFLEEGDSGEEEHQCVVSPLTPPTGNLAHNPGICPDWESNLRPFGSQAGAQPTEPHRPGPVTQSLITGASTKNLGRVEGTLLFLPYSSLCVFIPWNVGIRLEVLTPSFFKQEWTSVRARVTHYDWKSKNTEGAWDVNDIIRHHFLSLACLPSEFVKWKIQILYLVKQFVLVSLTCI